MTQQSNLEFVWKREYSFTTALVASKSYIPVFEISKCPRIEIKGEGEKGWFSIYAPADAITHIKSWCAEIIKDQKKLQAEIELCHKRGEAFIAVSQKIKNPEIATVPQLISWYQEYLDAFEEYCISIWITLYLADVVINVMKDELHKTHTQSEVETIFANLTPIKIASVHHITDYFRKESDVHKRIEYIKKNFAWIGSNDPFASPLTDAQIEDYAKTITQAAAPKIAPLKDETPLIKAYRELLYIKDKRDEYRRTSYFEGHKRLLELAKKVNLTTEQLSHLQISEIQTKGCENICKERKDAYVLEYAEHKWTINQGAQAKSRFIKKENHDNKTQVKGTIGNKGKVQGHVSIITSKKDVLAFEKGKVLVANSTNPEHVPAMQKAIAFVTDEGGITSHAAILARELGKPCVVGTKHATHVFKNGDLVEVDANTGIVKKI